jgi:hypothetical protein
MDRLLVYGSWFLLIRLANTDILDADWNNFLLGIASKITGESSQELPSEFVQ